MLRASLCFFLCIHILIVLCADSSSPKPKPGGGHTSTSSPRPHTSSPRPNTPKPQTSSRSSSPNRSGTSTPKPKPHSSTTRTPSKSKTAQAKKPFIWVIHREGKPAYIMGTLNTQLHDTIGSSKWKYSYSEVTRAADFIFATDPLSPNDVTKCMELPKGTTAKDILGDELYQNYVARYSTCVPPAMLASTQPAYVVDNARLCVNITDKKTKKEDFNPLTDDENPWHMSREIVRIRGTLGTHNKIDVHPLLTHQVLCQEQAKFTANQTRDTVIDALKLNPTTTYEAPLLKAFSDGATDKLKKELVKDHRNTVNVDAMTTLLVESILKVLENDKYQDRSRQDILLLVPIQNLVLNDNGNVISELQKEGYTIERVCGTEKDSCVHPTTSRDEYKSSRRHRNKLLNAQTIKVAVGTCIAVVTVGLVAIFVFFTYRYTSKKVHRRRVKRERLPEDDDEISLPTFGDSDDDRERGLEEGVGVCGEIIDHVDLADDFDTGLDDPAEADDNELRADAPAPAPAQATPPPPKKEGKMD